MSVMVTRDTAVMSSWWSQKVQDAWVTLQRGMSRTQLPLGRIMCWLNQHGEAL